MNYFIGDLHLFNRNQTGEGVNYDGRPFATVAEMNQYIIEHWNAKITNGDIPAILLGCRQAVKAPVSDTGICWFESNHPSHTWRVNPEGLGTAR